MEIVLAEDHAMIRTALRMLLEAQPRFKVIAEAGTVQETLEAVGKNRPDVLILDLNMPDGSTISAIPTLRAIAPRTSIVVLTANHAPGIALQAIRAGAQSYLLKDAADTELVRAVEMVAEGRQYLQPEIGALLVNRGSNDRDTGELSAREVEVLRLLVLGYTRKEIADQLQLSVRTVESHRARIQQKLSLPTRAGLVRYALTHGIVDESLENNP
jgi:two-component system response regulator NreC